MSRRCSATIVDIRRASVAETESKNAGRVVPAVSSRGIHMLDESRLPRHHAVTLAGRILFTLIFLLSGITHFTDIDGYTPARRERVVG